MNYDYDTSTVTLRLGDQTWHDGPGWYYTVDEYEDEGSCGAFETKQQAVDHAVACGYTEGATVDDPNSTRAKKAGA